MPLASIHSLAEGHNPSGVNPSASVVFGEAYLHWRGFVDGEECRRLITMHCHERNNSTGRWNLRGGGLNQSCDSNCRRYLLIGPCHGSKLRGTLYENETSNIDEKIKFQEF